MSRVIKFRAWDKATEGFWQPAPMGMIYFTLFSRPGFLDNTYCEKGSNEFVNRFEVMQFTGLRDKDGAEICEGDIVKAFCNINKISDPCLTEREPQYDFKMVKKMNGSFVLSTKKYNFCGVLGFSRSTMPEDLPVVGNIYENPELLK